MVYKFGKSIKLRINMKLLELPLAKPLWHAMVRRWPVFCCKLLYRKALGGVLNLETPKDLNEKIQWLKFHADMNEWARLADKYAVREYVKERGLEDILVKLYGKYDTPDELMADWDNLPEKFVLKSNNGCGTVRLITCKSKEDREEIRRMTKKWLKQKDIGLGTVELHYTLIKPCLIAEELLEDPSVKDYSCSLIDYKIWCFNGKPYGFFMAYDRNLLTGHHVFDFYNINWEQHTEKMTDKSQRHPIKCPENLNQMLDVASSLSRGHAQMRVDLYDVNGKIYLGELTMTSQGGYMDYFTKDLLLEMGNQIDLKNTSIDNNHIIVD